MTDQRMAITEDGTLKPVAEFTPGEKWWCDGGECGDYSANPHVHCFGHRHLVNLLNGYDERHPLFHETPAPGPRPPGAGQDGGEVEHRSLPPRRQGVAAPEPATSPAIPPAGGEARPSRFPVRDGRAQAPAGRAAAPPDGESPGGGDAVADAAPSPGGQAADERKAQRKAWKAAQSALRAQQRRERARPWAVKRQPGYGAGGNRRMPPPPPDGSAA